MHPPCILEGLYRLDYQYTVDLTQYIYSRAVVEYKMAKLEQGRCSIPVDVIWAFYLKMSRSKMGVQIPSKNVDEQGGGFDERGFEPLFTGGCSFGVTSPYYIYTHNLDQEILV